MKRVSAINNSSDDGRPIQQAIKRGLISLSVVIILLSGTALWTIFELTDFYKNKVNIVAEQGKLVNHMRLAARERTLLMYAMVVETDTFKQDDKRMAFYSAGAKFAQARVAFIETPLTDYERQILDAQGKVTGVNRAIQAEIVDLVLNDEDELALELLWNEALPNQLKVMASLDQLDISVAQRKSEIAAKAELIGKASTIIIIFIIIIVIFGSLYIIRKTTYRTSNLILQLIKARKTLQKTNDELISQKDTLDHHAIVSIADKYGNITYVNDKFCEISGYSREELIGKNHRVLKSGVHPKEFYKKLWGTISSGNVWQGEICNKRKGGGEYWVESTISPFVDSSGMPYQYVSVRTDITHLLEARIAAEKANKAKSTFLTSMSHEIRTPMNAVIGFSELLQMDLKGEQLESAKQISMAGHHLMSIINEILDLSKIDSEQSNLSIEKVNVETLIVECFKMLENMALDKNIKLHKKINTPSDFQVMADRIRLKQALLNYISNAIKYNSLDGEVEVSTRLVEPDRCRILVTDSGPGLNKEQCSIVFNPFTRLDSHVNIIEGTGIGLTITKRIIEKMNGTVGVDSEVGKGSVFWLEMPIA